MRYISTSMVAIASFCITGTSLGDFWGVELTASDGASGDQFGSSVAIDGDTCVIGARGTNSFAGSAYVYTSDADGNWSQVAELTAADGANFDYFGSNVAIDGDTCVIGANGTNSFAGSAYVYTSDAGGNWSQVAELTAADGESGDGFGSTIAIAGDTCVIGAQGTNSDTGSAYVYTSDEIGNWSQVAELTAADGEGGDQFGISVAIDGDTCVIGARGTNSFAGSAYVYTSDVDGNWSQVAELTAADGEGGDQFGISVAIDGDTCVIGASKTNSITGSAYVNTSDADGNWSEVAELTALDGAIGARFGSSVAVAGDTCVIGAYAANTSGSAYVFTPDAGGNWSQVAELTAADGEGDAFFGLGVAIDGDTCVIGAYGTDPTGSAYVYGSNAAPAEPTGACCVSSGCVATADDDCTALGGTWIGEGGSCDSCPAACPADILGGGNVDIYDLLELLEDWGPCP